MKFIFSFLLYLILLSPTYADMIMTGQPNQDSNLNTSTPCDNYDSTTCDSHGGCYWSTDDSLCMTCSSYTYSPAGANVCSRCVNTNAESAYESNSNYNFQETDWHNDASTHPQYSVFSVGNGGQAWCPWICEAGYYRGGADLDSCEPCPLHSPNCRSDGESGLYYNTVTCDTEHRYHPVIDSENHTVICSDCHDNATLTGGVCVCNASFYGDGRLSCTLCPAGTTSTMGSNTALANCFMPNDVKFCYEDRGETKCMQLIQNQP